MLSLIVGAVTTPPNGFQPPGTEIFDFTKSCVLGSGPYCLTKVSLLALFASALIVILFLSAFLHPKVVPTKFQNVMEAFVDFIRTGIVIEVIGPDGLPFLPLLTALFAFIWVNNTFGVIPFIQFPPTSRLAVTGFLAVLVWVVFNVVAIRKQGGWGYLKGVLFPPGVPKILLYWIPLVPLVEFVSTFLVRPLTLAIRLAANMIAGHLIVTIFALGSYYLTAEFGRPGVLTKLLGTFGVASMAFLIVMVVFEIFVAFLQAYIFTILTAVYISGAMHPEH